MITQVSPKSKSFDFQARRISIFMFIFQKGFFSMWVKSKGPGKGQKPLKPNQIIFTGSLLTQELIHWKKKKIHHNLPPSKTLLWMKANPAPKKYAVYWLLGKHLLKGKSQHSPETVLSDQGRGGTGSRGWGGWDRPTNQAESSGKGWGPQMRRWAGIGGSSPVAPLASPGRWGCLWHAAPHKVLDHQEKTSYPPPHPGRKRVDLFIPGSKLKSPEKSQTDIKCFLIECTENSVEFLPQMPTLNWNIRKHKKTQWNCCPPIETKETENWTQHLF